MSYIEYRPGCFYLDHTGRPVLGSPPVQKSHDQMNQAEREAFADRMADAAMQVATIDGRTGIRTAADIPGVTYTP